MRKKLLATLLAVVLILGLIPLSSFGKGVAYAESAPPRITSFTIENGTQLIDKKSSAVVGTVNGVEVIQKAVKKTYNDDYGMDLYYLGDITIYYTADADISATAKIDGIQSEFAKNGYPDALWNDDYSEIEIYPDNASNVMILSADDEAAMFFTYKLTAVRESAPPRITSFTIENGTQLIDKKSSAVVGTVNGVEVIQKAVKKTYNDDYGMDLYYLGDITIYYTADADISATAKIDGIQSEFAKNGYPDALWNDDYSEIEIYPDNASNVMILSADDEAAMFFTYKLTAVRGSADDADTTAPTLTAGGVTRVSESEATVYFRADEAGEYYYAYGDLGSEIEVDTSQHSTSMDEGENTLTISGLASGAKILHIIAKDTSGNTMEEPLEIIIPAYNQDAAEWPQLIAFLLPSNKWSVSGIELTADNVKIEQYPELVPYGAGNSSNTYYAGKVILDYQNARVAKPSYSDGTLNGWEGYVQSPAGFQNVAIHKTALNLNKGTSEFSLTASRNGINYTYYYQVCVSGTNMLYKVPDTWKLDESGSEFTYSPTSYQRDYNNWQMLSRGVEYTWGTTSDKENLNFTSGSDSFTLTNGEGNTQTYTVTLDMPWEFNVLPQKGYDLSALLAGAENLSGYRDLSKPNGTVTQGIRSGRAVTVSIKPTGDNKNKVIDAVTLTKSRDKTAISASDITITGNTFSFVMPNDCVEVTSITFKEDTSERYTISASATRYRNENIYAMGTVTITDGENPIGDTHAGNEVTVTATPVEHAAYKFKFVRWDAKGVELTKEQESAATMTFEMPAKNVSLTAVFEKQGVKLNFSASPASALSGVDLVSMTEGNHMTFFTSREDTVKPGAEIAVRPTGTSQFVLVGYEVKDQAGNNISYEVGDFDGCQFTVPKDATSISVVAKYRAKAFSTITMGSNDAAMGSASATVEGKPVGAAVTEGATVTVTATAKFRYKFTSWSAAYADGSTVDFELTSAEENPNVATFTVPTSGKGIVITANFKRDETQNSNRCQLTGVGLYDEETKIGMLSKSGLNYTITLPVDTDTANLANMILKLTISEFATVTKENDPDKNWVEGAPCGMALDTQAKFTVTAEDGTTNVYTITIKKAAAPNAPTLSNGSATRTSKTGATVKFTSSEAGNYFYKVVDHGAAVPTVDEIMKSTTKGTASAGETTFTLSNLTEDARDIYIVVVNASGGKSAALKVEIPTYGSGTDTPDTGAYKISIRAPKGGTITTNRTKADASDEIIVTVTPDNGYQMVSGSLTYTLEKAGGETKTISNGRFTMPAGDVSITCKWETATTTAKGITSFSINGVAGAVNNTINTITITMPRGTDVTKLTPVIATNGVKSLTPGSGETVDFTNAVTYTAAMEDGSSKTYTVTVYVDKGTLADQFWDKLTDFATQVPWWQYAEKQQSTSKYPKYW